ncbi:MAG: 2Fe-2S iron-sulfur cluster binding domain-containing protein [Actinophytocola sp.]|nr:2Fe-2S iron-sulfur cluster binding domain-containing protein [Actinophytocola sp.]
MPETGYVEARVRRVVAETPDAVSLELDVPAEDAPRFRYRPGQFLTLRIPSERTGSVARCYSLSSAPGDPLTVTVKRVADGYGSNWLCDNAAEGTVLGVLPPAGVFTPKSLDDDLLLCAGGSGITPLMSILRSVLVHGTGSVTLLYANRDEGSVIFAAALAELSRQYPERLTVLHWLESVQGLPTRAQLARLAAPHARREAFVCGPAAFMAAATDALRDAGVDRVHVERFVSLSRNPFHANGPVTAEPDDASADVEVELDGDTHSYAWPRGTVLLDLLLAHGLDAPYSCREGACSACACLVTDGEVKMLANEVLAEADLAEGYVLACQAIPVTDTVKITYS